MCQGNARVATCLADAPRGCVVLDLRDVNVSDTRQSVRLCKHFPFRRSADTDGRRMNIDDGCHMTATGEAVSAVYDSCHANVTDGMKGEVTFDNFHMNVTDEQVVGVFNDEFQGNVTNEPIANASYDNCHTVSTRNCHAGVTDGQVARGFSHDRCHTELTDIRVTDDASLTRQRAVNDACLFNDNCQCDGVTDQMPFAIYDGKIDIPMRF
ncbi:unnamed protein product [Colias eurytheme]|nr:unnamed protein product [Colias eurytheme]